ncbi:hypothetical protein KA078_00045 [Candidatus Woesebacteria bacterium]|nr:hypothetical protein [Candidatus Woesebacteria bacterium]
MPIISQRQPRYNPAGEAVSREQRRRAELDLEQRNKQLPVFEFMGFHFQPRYTDRMSLQMDGALCSRPNRDGRPCLAELSSENEEATRVTCEVCGFSGELPHGHQKLRQLAKLAYEGYKRLIDNGGQIITLDVPYEAIKASDEDESRAIRIKWSQKDGRNMAVIYFIEKDANGGKTQIFADMDREEVRYDASDIPPGKILAKVRAEFVNTQVEIDYNK